MDPRKRFKSGLLLIYVGFLGIAWSTWCAESSFGYSWSSAFERFWKGITERHDISLFLWTAMVGGVVFLGVFRCVDALVWGGADAEEDSVVDESSEVATASDGG